MIRTFGLFLCFFCIRCHLACLLRPSATITPQICQMGWNLLDDFSHCMSGNVSFDFLPPFILTYHNGVERFCTQLPLNELFFFFSVIVFAFFSCHQTKQGISDSEHSYNTFIICRGSKSGVGIKPPALRLTNALPAEPQTTPLLLTTVTTDSKHFFCPFPKKKKIVIGSNLLKFTVVNFSFCPWRGQFTRGRGHCLGWPWNKT